MTAEDKNRFDSISVMYKQAWNNFNERRKYESKISFGVYTVYAFTIAGIFIQMEKDTIKGDIFLPGIIVIGLLVLILHGLYLKGASKANFIDRKIAVHFEKHMQKLTATEFDNDFKTNFISKTNLSESKIPFFLCTWDPRVSLLISFILYLSLILTTWVSSKSY
jgi:hypothetical protein